MPLIDVFDGWFVIDHEKLKKAIKNLPPHLRKYEAIRKNLGIGSQQLSDYISGRRHPNLTNLKKLCLYLQISADELLGLETIIFPKAVSKETDSE